MAINDPSFFETYPVENKLIVIIDKTGGCYPMILKGEKRVSGFKSALQDVKRNFTKIFKIIKGNTFNETLHCKLERNFNYGDS